MFRVFLDTFDELDFVLDRMNLNKYLLLDKEFLEKLCSFLEVFDDVIEQLRHGKLSTIYKILPFRRLLDESEIKPNDSDGLKAMNFYLCRLYVVLLYTF